MRLPGGLDWQVSGRGSTVVDAPPVASGSNRFSPLTEIDNEKGTTSRDTAGREYVEVLPHDVSTPWASSVGPDGQTQRVSDAEGVGRAEVVRGVWF